ncbi:hypothetical protein RTBOTA2_006247 [Rhodotorula toruloides]|uniref:F-box domain-containing protein n=1 Tax=Rhodotorula toruloides TaxID=5286 RepID=A0A2S9ZYM1_RHOTO|nr:hypothetical protein RTBOTA2_006247 [Rhodotorula toruloides]PRQ70855.1 hypothetical protein AAT19DRAFT_11012 [Rhodotorula toruloides]
MPVTLPLELQHRILELALPPLILSRLDERAQLCKTLSLVHRTWTRVAQRELHEHVSCANEASILELTAVLQRLYLFNTIIRDAASIIDEPTFRNLTYLYVRDTGFGSLPADLRLQTLLLCCVGLDFHDKTFFAGLSALRILGLIATVPLPHVADNLPPLLRHLAYYDVDWEESDDGADDDEARLAAFRAAGEKHRPTMAKLAQRLDSCTTNTDSGERRPWSYVLEEEVVRASGRFTVNNEDDFDLEEWAWSLGA